MMEKSKTMKKFKTIELLKTFITVFAVGLLFFASITEVISQNNQGNQNLKNGFYLGPMSHFFHNSLRTQIQMQRYDSLYYNLMFSYCAHLDNIDPGFQQNGQKDGGFFEDINNYRTAMQGVIEQWYNFKNLNLNSLIFEREKILRPAYGQRFTYQAEYPGTWHTKFPAYGYDSTNVTGIDVSDSNGISKHCMVGRDAPGFMVKGLYENCSQTNNLKRVSDSTNSSGWERLYSDIKQRKYNMRWFIKPRMRVDVNTIYSHLNDTLVKIYVKNFSGNYIDSFSIKGLNFLDSNSSYDGRYLENFYNFPTNYHDLSVLSDSLAVGKVILPDSLFLPDSLSKVDYQVKWLGKVDVWLDYVRVDDSWAHYLFTDTWENEPNNPNNMWKFHRRIKEEVEAFANKPGLAYFWVDEVQFPNLECIGEVNRLVKQYSDSTMSLLFITDPIAFMGWPAFRASTPSSTVNQTNWDTCINRAIRFGALSDVMITQWFPFYYTIINIRRNWKVDELADYIELELCRRFLPGEGD